MQFCTKSHHSLRKSLWNVCKWRRDIAPSLMVMSSMCVCVCFVVAYGWIPSVAYRCCFSPNGHRHVSSRLYAQALARFNILMTFIHHSGWKKLCSPPAHFTNENIRNVAKRNLFTISFLGGKWCPAFTKTENRIFHLLLLAVILWLTNQWTGVCVVTLSVVQRTFHLKTFRTDEN